ncbi:helix-turn-helix transcriptional regulator [Alkalimonas mucilaginosa]|uniref:WYL domain-containing protein n=1 Tax=Alkalimonas mucilaginosa TaxID=3057676 RepID=A0ABU7JGR3_9GAMM|nr:WYL domain-containing protein [Alkalimonas sp. MEB004]MEE2024874.1 WYL domain-containing protein [Alkalimonas sp. MEB004]
MSSAKSAQTISRLWELLQLLPARPPGAEARQLTAQLHDRGYAVTKRTVERDLQMLSGIFPLQCNDKGTPYGWYWMQNTALDLPGISLMDALSLQLVEQSLRFVVPSSMLQPLTSRFMQAHNKLRALQEDAPGAAWLDKVAVVEPGMALLPPAVDAVLLESIQEALLRDKQLDAQYMSPHHNAPKSYRLNPLALVQRGAVSYLIASCVPYHDPLRFVLHRFKSATLCDEAAIRPAGFKLQNYLASGAMQFSEGEQIKLEAQVRGDLVTLLQETPLSHDMILQPCQDESYRLTATVFSGIQLDLWLMMQSSSLTVIAPASLRERVIKRLSKAMQQYQHNE